MQKRKKIVTRGSNPVRLLEETEELVESDCRIETLTWLAKMLVSPSMIRGLNAEC